MYLITSQVHIFLLIRELCDQWSHFTCRTPDRTLGRQTGVCGGVLSHFSEWRHVGVCCILVAVTRQQTKGLFWLTVWGDAGRGVWGGWSHGFRSQKQGVEHWCSSRCCPFGFPACRVVPPTPPPSLTLLCVHSHGLGSPNPRPSHHNEPAAL